MELSAPGKTFLVGEYLALDGGPSLLISTSPRFVLTLVKNNQSHSRENASGASAFFHPESPAGKFIARHPDFWSEWSFSFKDPHKGLGGLGASSAQFALLYAFQNNWQEKSFESFDWQELLKVYRECAWNGVGTPPSGADVVSQLCGGLTWFDGREMKAQRLAWNFPELSFTLIRTGVKLATHEHLKSRQTAPYENLREIMSQAYLAVQNSDEALMIRSVQRYSELLDKANLLADGTKALIDDLLSQKESVLAAKGCGAMGADVILVLHSRKKATEISSWAKSRSLEICGSLDDLSTGLGFIAD